MASVMVRLMNEYGLDFPIWLRPARDATPEQAARVEVGAAEPGDLPLSGQLVTELHAWAKDFNEHFHWDTGWDWSAPQVTAYRQRSEQLADRLRTELDDSYIVVPEIWECQETRKQGI